MIDAWWVLVVLLALGGWVNSSLAQAPAPPQVDAARSDAMDNLRQEVLAAHIEPDITVQMLIDRTGGIDALNKALAGARQIGGPRWLDPQTAQIRLEIKGTAVADALEKLAREHPGAISIGPDVVRERVARWKLRSFSAIGTGTSPGSAARLRPDPSQVSWQQVSDQSRQRAIEAARQDAVDRIIESLKPISWNDRRTLADALDNKEVAEIVRGWLNTRPVTTVEFRDNLEVRLTLAVAPDDLWPVLKGAMERGKSVPKPKASADWQHLHQQVDARMANPCGSAAATAVIATRPAITIPTIAPAWTRLTLDGQAQGQSPNGLLRAARSAKVAALAQIRAQINALPLTAHLTLGDASHQDPRIDQAITHALDHAQISKIEYDAPNRGWATAHMTLDLDELWRELSDLAH